MESLFFVLCGIAISFMFISIKQILERKAIDKELLELVNDKNVDMMIIMGVHRIGKMVSSKLIPVPADHTSLSKLLALRGKGFEIQSVEAFDPNDQLHQSALAIGIKARQDLLEQLKTGAIQRIDEGRIILPPIGVLKAALGDTNRRGLRDALKTQIHIGGQQAEVPQWTSAQNRTLVF